MMKDRTVSIALEKNYKCILLSVPFVLIKIQQKAFSRSKLMATYQVPKTMLIYSSKHTTSDTRAITEATNFPELTVIYIIFQYLFCFALMCKEKTCLLNKDTPPFRYLRVILISSFLRNEILYFTYYFGQVYGESSFRDFHLNLIVSMPGTQYIR